MSKEKKEKKIEEEVSAVNEVKDDEEKVIDIIENNEVDELKKEIDKLKNDYARAYADTENLKRRLQNEAEMTRKYRIQSFALEVLPVIDNLERALQVEIKEDQQSFYQGIKMIYQQLITALQNEGVKEIDCLNQKYDANFAQAIGTEKVEGVEEGIVIQVLQKGYMLKDRILRAAMVKISE